jgi:archaellum component FlaC
MKKRNITIEDLARMVKNGFEETAKRKEVNSRFNEVDSRFNIVENRLDKIEKLILADHKRRIERLEFEVKELKDLFAIK